MNTNLYDVAIIGGGPAGCSAAITLAQRGARVVLCEAKNYPHHKVCGEFLSPECTYLLDQLGLSTSIRSLNPVEIGAFCLTGPDSSVWETRLPGSAWGLSRWTLDAALARHVCLVGVELREETTVCEIRGNLPTGFELTIRTPHSSDTLGARAVVGAQGKRSALDRTLDRRFMHQSQPYTALKAHFKGPPLPGRIELHTFPGGYCGMSEIEDGTANVCLLVRTASFQRNSGSGLARIPRFVAWMKAQNPSLGRWLDDAHLIGESWYTISQIPFVEKQPVVGDVLMAGDSAGVIAPLAGDGIAMALASGQMAGRYFADYLAGQRPAEEIKIQYAAEWRRNFRARLRLGRLLHSLIFEPRYVSLALRVINAIPALGDYLVRQTRDIGLIRQGARLS